MAEDKKNTRQQDNETMRQKTKRLRAKRSKTKRSETLETPYCPCQKYLYIEICKFFIF